MEIQKYEQQITAIGRIPQAIMPKTKNEVYPILQKWPKEYYKTLCPKTFNDVFLSITPSLATYRKAYGENGEIAVRAILSIIINSLIESFNLGQTMNDRQVADLINDIIDRYYWLNLDDFRLCFNCAIDGMYDKAIFRLDKSVVMSWLNKYTTDRLNAADESSYNAHLSYSGDSRVSEFDEAYKQFEKRRIK